MQPQEQSDVYTPSTQTNETSSESIRRSNKKKLVWGLICLLGPTLLLVVALTAYALLNFVFANFSSSDVPATSSVSNIILFLVGAITFLTWLPGIIVGIILLTKRQRI